MKISVQRRRLVAGIAASAGLGTFGALAASDALAQRSKRAIGPRNPAQDLRGVIDEMVLDSHTPKTFVKRQEKAASTILDAVIAAGAPMSRRDHDRLIARELDERRRTVDGYRRVAQRGSGAGAPSGDTATDPEARAWIVRIGALGLPLSPPLRFLIQPGTPVLPPAGRTDETPAENNVLDIVLAALDTGLPAAGIGIEAAQRLPALWQALGTLAGAARTNDWRRAATASERVIREITRPAFFAHIGQARGTAIAREAERRIAFQSVVRLVPYVGWRYMNFAVLVTLKQNAHRLG